MPADVDAPLAGLSRNGVTSFESSTDPYGTDLFAYVIATNTRYQIRGRQSQA